MVFKFIVKKVHEKYTKTYSALFCNVLTKSFGVDVCYVCWKILMKIAFSSYKSSCHFAQIILLIYNNSICKDR